MLPDIQSRTKDYFFVDYIPQLDVFKHLQIAVRVTQNSAIQQAIPVRIRLIRSTAQQMTFQIFQDQIVYNTFTLSAAGQFSIIPQLYIKNCYAIVDAQTFPTLSDMNCQLLSQAVFNIPAGTSIGFLDRELKWPKGDSPIRHYSTQSGILKLVDGFNTQVQIVDSVVLITAAGGSGKGRVSYKTDSDSQYWGLCDINGQTDSINFLSSPSLYVDYNTSGETINLSLRTKGGSE